MEKFDFAAYYKHIFSSFIYLKDQKISFFFYSIATDLKKRFPPFKMHVYCWMQPTTIDYSFLLRTDYIYTFNTKSRTVVDII